MKIPINQIAHGIGMQNQYLGLAVKEGKVVGEIHNDYHDDQSWVDTDSVRLYLRNKMRIGNISEEQYQKAIIFLDQI